MSTPSGSALAESGADVPSKIVAVTVFTDRARVTRQGKATLEPGTRRVQFTNLPASLDPESLRVAVRGTVPVKLLGVDSRRTFSAETVAVRVRDLEARMQALTDEDTADTDATATLAKELLHLDGLADAGRIYAYGLANGKSTLDQQGALLDFIEHRRTRVAERMRAIAITKRNRGRVIQQLQHEVNLARTTQPREQYAVAVEVALDAAGEVEVDLTYVLTGASWSPLYDVRLRGDELEVTYLAEVKQNTGEDWMGIALALSTAQPSHATALPILKPWHLYLHSYGGGAPKGGAATWSTGSHPASTSMTRASRVDVMSAEMMMMALPSMVEAEVEVAQVEEKSGGSVTFQIPSSTDVPSDNTPHKSTIGVFRNRPQFDYVSVPKLARPVYRRVQMANPSAYTLLPGRAQLFLDDDYLGATDLPHTAPGQLLKLFFGTDDRLRIDRSQLKRDVGKSFLGGRRRLQFTYEIRVWNHTKAVQQLTIVDQIPLAQHEDIKVTLDAVDPKPARQDDLNILIWKLSLDAGAEKKIGFTFTVDQPREMTLGGLN